MRENEGSCVVFPSAGVGVEDIPLQYIWYYYACMYCILVPDVGSKNVRKKKDIYSLSFKKLVNYQKRAKDDDDDMRRPFNRKTSSFIKSASVEVSCTNVLREKFQNLKRTHSSSFLSFFLSKTKKKQRLTHTLCHVRLINNI